MSSITASASVTDSLDSFAVQLAEWVGFGQEENTPDDYSGTVVERVNYLNSRLNDAYNSASNGKIALQRTLSEASTDVGVTNSLGIEEPAKFSDIDQQLSTVLLQYKIKLGQLNDDLIAANSRGIMVVGSSGYKGEYDGKEHGISVNVDTSVYGVKYGVTEDSCDLDSSPTYSSVGVHPVYYQVVGGSKSLSGFENVEIIGLPGSITLSGASSSIAMGYPITVTATNKSGGNITAVSSNTSAVTISKSGNKFTLTPVGNGSSTITFVGEAGGIYQGATKSFTTTVIPGYKLTYSVSEHTSVNMEENVYVYVGYDAFRTCKVKATAIAGISYVDVYGQSKSIVGGSGTVYVKPGTKVSYSANCYVSHNVSDYHEGSVLLNGNLKTFRVDRTNSGWSHNFANDEFTMNSNHSVYISANAEIKLYNNSYYLSAFTGGVSVY